MRLEIPRGRVYESHEGQHDFHDDVLKVRHRGLIGGTGSGKTDAGAVETIVWVLEYPGSIGAIFEPSYPMVKRILIPKFEELLGGRIENSPLVHSFHKGDMLVTWKRPPGHDGPLSQTWLGSLDDPESAEGQNLDFIWVDEPRLIRHLDVAFDVALRRLRGSSYGRAQGYPAGSWWTTTPDFPGSVLHTFFEHAEDKNPNSQVYRMSLLDNRDNLPQAYVEEILARFTGGAYDRFVLGLFAAVEAGALKFDYSVHVIHEKEIDGEIWFVNEADKPIVPLIAIRKMSYGHDFGWTAPAAQIAIGWDGDGRALALDELYKAQATEQELIDNALELEEEYGQGNWWCDPSEPRTIRKLRLGGLRNRARPYKGKREDGLTDLGSRFQPAGDGLCRLYIHRRCVNTISELQEYDPKKKERDHGVDGLRYGVMGEKKERRDITADRDRSRARTTRTRRR